MSREPDIRALFDAWNLALQMRDPDRVASLYAPDAILLPTFSRSVRHNGAEIRDYFAHFLRDAPAGEIVESNVHIFGDTAVHSGVYAFTFSPPSRPRRRIAARFTFVYHLFGERWLITEHHSSAMPPE